MTLNVMVAQPVTEANLLSHNLDDPNEEYAAGVIYAQGDVVKIAARKRLYESVHDDNQGNPPPLTGSDVNWLDLGPMLPWRLFDGGPSSAAQSVGPMEFEIAGTKLARGFALVGVVASQVSYTVLSLDGAVVVPEVLLPLVSTDHIVDAFTLFFVPLEPQDLGIVDDMLFGDGEKLRVRIGQPGESVIVGEFLHGDVHRTGRVTSGVRSDLVDFSTEIVDPKYGTSEIIERGYTFNRDYPLRVWPNRVAGRTERLLASLVAKRALYWAGRTPQFAIDAGLVTYGRLVHHVKTSTADDISDFNATVEGRL